MNYYNEYLYNLILYYYYIFIEFRGNNHKNKPKKTLYPEILLAVDVSSEIKYDKNIE